MTATSIFHPYKLINQGRTSLQLEAGSSQKSLVWILRGIPFFTFLFGVFAYFFSREIFVFLMLAGIALIEAIALSFVKSPGSVSMDSIGFTMDVITLKGIRQVSYLWNDVDYIQHKTVSAKHTTTLVYDAILKEGKKVRFLAFPAYQDKLQSLTEINSTLSNISSKEVTKKI